MNAELDYTAVVFDGPPSHESGRFVECEAPDGRSINAGEWVRRDDGLWELRVPSHAALLTAAREADSLREQCNVAARVASDAMREAEEWKAKALRWDAERQIVAGHYDDVRADYLELREWQREAAGWLAEFRGARMGAMEIAPAIDRLLARVKS